MTLGVGGFDPDKHVLVLSREYVEVEERGPVNWLARTSFGRNMSRAVLGQDYYDIQTIINRISDISFLICIQGRLREKALQKWKRDSDEYVLFLRRIHIIPVSADVPLMGEPLWFLLKCCSVVPWPPKEQHFEVHTHTYAAFFSDTYQRRSREKKVRCIFVKEDGVFVRIYSEDATSQHFKWTYSSDADILFEISKKF